MRYDADLRSKYAGYDGKFQFGVTGIMHPSIHYRALRVARGVGVNPSCLRSEGGVIPQTSFQKANTCRPTTRPKCPSVKELQIPLNPACSCFDHGTKLNTQPQRHHRPAALTCFAFIFSKVQLVSPICSFRF